MLLGDAGLALNDFDYDPDSLVPALDMGDPGYTAELDKSVPRDQRAQFFHQQFLFSVAPNSILAMHAQEEKMMRMQLFRMQVYDMWSLGESLEIPNMGTPPPMPLPPLEEPNPEEVMADLAGQAGLTPDPLTGQPTGMPMPPKKYVLDPATGQVLEIRVPMTVTERLMAQTMLGIGGSVNPASAEGAGAGRPASGGSEPKVEEKKDGMGAPRTTITESSDSRNA
jgi:hypothetical protein